MPDLYQTLDELGIEFTKFLRDKPGRRHFLLTVLGLINDPSHAVALYVDADVWKRDWWNCHPLINNATLVLSRASIETFLAHTGHMAQVVTSEAGPAP